MREMGMQFRKHFQDVMHYLVHHSIWFTVVVMCLVHVCLIILNWVAGVLPLAYFNIVSVIIYMFCILLCNTGHVMPVYVSIFLEVSLYSTASVMLTGWDCGGQCFLVSIIPIIIYIGCFLLKDAQRLIVLFLLAANFGLYIFLYISFAESHPLYVVPTVARIILMIFSSFAMVFSVCFYTIMHIYSNEYEVGHLEEEKEQLSADAHADALTGLLNRRGFLPCLESLMKEADSHFCLAFFDIDNFKRINDSFGHDGGDEVLRHISRLIRKEMVGCEVCRWGGEEFLVLMKDYNMDVAKQRMEYLRKTIEATPTVFFNKFIQVTTTIGLEEKKDEYTEVDDIIKVADTRMYYGKQHGKNILIYEDAK